METPRYRICAVAAKLVRTGRSWQLQLDRDWPWAQHLQDAFNRLRAAPGQPDPPPQRPGTLEPRTRPASRARGMSTTAEHRHPTSTTTCLLYTSDAADEEDSVD